MKSAKTKIPREFSSFMYSCENKSHLMNMIFDYIIDNRIECLNITKASKIILSQDKKC